MVSIVLWAAVFISSLVVLSVTAAFVLFLCGHYSVSVAVRWGTIGFMAYLDYCIELALDTEKAQSTLSEEEYKEYIYIKECGTLSDRISALERLMSDGYITGNTLQEAEDTFRACYMRYRRAFACRIVDFILYLENTADDEEKSDYAYSIMSAYALLHRSFNKIVINTICDQAFTFKP